MRYFGDLTEQQTADALNCSLGTVKSQVARALDKLRADESLTSLLEDFQ
jgi:DNA-directed RNA polymerase specialized sigma24 family protein